MVGVSTRCGKRSAHGFGVIASASSSSSVSSCPNFPPRRTSLCRSCSAGSTVTKPFVSPGRWFDRLDLHGTERHRAGEMSGGQSQRVALARGLVTHPDVLFADEPTGSLDSLNGELVMGLLTRTAREQGSTVILVTHEPRVAAYADRDVIVRDGRVATATSVPG